ncbi:hypothetical protein FRC03_006071 [Tulasnella sp. 419]|nr:hypothetical protein FRC03_006071 [Tulasnella sp. 419]
MVYRANGTNLDLLIGIKTLFTICQSMETLHHAVVDGHVKAHTTASRPPHEIRRGFNENDGRAPDTHLLLSLAEKAASHLASATMDEQLSILANHQAQVNSVEDSSNALPAPRVLQSYKWQPSNTCYIDSSLELLFCAWCKIPSELKTWLLTEAKNHASGSALYVILDHFYKRAKWIEEQPKSQAKKIAKSNRGLDYQGAVAMGQTHMRTFIVSHWKIVQPTEYGCARTWLSLLTNRLGKVNSANECLSLSLQAPFTVQYAPVYRCLNGHQFEVACVPVSEIQLQSGDFHNVKALTSPASPTLSLYLSHMVPRMFDSPREPVHTVHPTRPCTHPGCTLVASQSTVVTKWPSVLCYFPGLGIYTLHPTEDTITILEDIKGSSEKDVSYQYIGRVISLANHFITEIIIDNKGYQYDGMLNNGTLVEIGSASKALHQNANVVYYMFTRTSESFITSRTCNNLAEELQQGQDTQQRLDPIIISDADSGNPVLHADIAKAIQNSLEDEILQLADNTKQAAKSKPTTDPFSPTPSPAPLKPYAVGDIIILPLPVDSDKPMFGPAIIIKIDSNQSRKESTLSIPFIMNVQSSEEFKKPGFCHLSYVISNGQKF